MEFQTLLPNASAMASEGSSDFNLRQRHSNDLHRFVVLTVDPSTIDEPSCPDLQSRSRYPLDSTGRPIRDFGDPYRQPNLSSFPWTIDVQLHRQMTIKGIEGVRLIQKEDRKRQNIQVRCVQ